MTAKFVILLIAAIVCSVAADSWIPVANTTGTVASRSYPYFFPLVNGSFYYGLGALTPIAQQVYNPATYTWTTVTTTGTTPEVGHFAGSHCTSPDGKQGIVFGGTIGSTRQSTVFLLNLTSLDWSQGATTPGSIPPRNLAQCLWLSTGKVLFFGGKNDNAFYNDLLQYDVAEASWTVIYASGNASNPIARSGATSTYANDKWYIFGGYTQSTTPITYTNNLAVLDVPSLTWIHNANVANIAPRIDAVSVLVNNNTWNVLSGSTTGTNTVGAEIVTIDLVAYTATSESATLTAAGVTPAGALSKGVVSPLNATSWLIVNRFPAVYSVDAPEESTSSGETSDASSSSGETSDESTSTEESTSSDSDSSSDDDTETATESSTVTDDNSGQAIIVPCVALLVSAIAALF